MIVFRRFLFGLLVTALLFSIPYTSYARELERDDDFYIARGIQKINEGKYNEALELLTQALRLSRNNSEAIYYAAIVHINLGNYGEAEDLFLRILQLDEANADVHFRLGRIYYIKAECDKAEKYLTRYQTLSKDDELNSAAAGLVRTCGSRGLKKKYSVNIAIGSQYDDNVMLEPVDPVSAEEKKSDTRAVLYLSSNIKLTDERHLGLYLDYNFYQSLHAHLSNYNLHYHKLSPFIETRFSRAFKQTLGYSFEYYIFGGEEYLKVHSIYAKLFVEEGRNMSTEALYLYEDRVFLDSDDFSSNSIRSGHQNTAGLKQKYYSGHFAGDIYWYGDYARAEEAYWSSDGYCAGLNMIYRLTPVLKVSAGGEYSESRYLDYLAGYQEKRMDEMRRYYFKVIYSISKRMEVSIAQTSIDNNSNIGSYDYEKNITGIFLTGGIL